jgi:hypothetical protein
VLDASIIRKMALIALMMEATSPSETSVNFYQTTWCNNAEDSQLHFVYATLESMQNDKRFAVIQQQAYWNLFFCKILYIVVLFPDM